MAASCPRFSGGALMTCSERQFFVNGYYLAAKEWNTGAHYKVIACHGWLDNAASFDVLSPLLINCHIIALDMPGHGLSDHKSSQANYNIWDDLLDILAVADDMGWEIFNLLGHSRGAIMSLLLAAAMPKRINAMVMLDAVLPQPIAIEDTVKQLHKYLVEQRRATTKTLPCYASIDEAVKARCKAAGLSEKSSRIIIERGLKKDADKFSWTSDARLTTPSAFKMSQEHNQVIADAVTVPNLLLLAAGGFGASKDFTDAIKNYKTINSRLIEGSHHFHMEQQAVLIAKIVAEFFVEHNTVL
jgi:pimeloyl-ACP methyl ester carboxylesterase